MEDNTCGECVGWGFVVQLNYASKYWPTYVFDHTDCQIKPRTPFYMAIFSIRLNTEPERPIMENINHTAHIWATFLCIILSLWLRLSRLHGTQHTQRHTKHILISLIPNSPSASVYHSVQWIANWTENARKISFICMWVDNNRSITFLSKYFTG